MTAAAATADDSASDAPEAALRAAGLRSHAAIDEQDFAEARRVAREELAAGHLDGRATGTLDSATLLEAALLLVDSDDAAADAVEALRWWLLRYAPRDDWGVLHHHADTPQVWAETVYAAVPALVASGDLAPADMQYRMVREQLWDAATGLYRAVFDMERGAFVDGSPRAAASGWVAAGIARALRLGVDAATVRERWQSETRAVLEACGNRTGADGTVPLTLDVPASPPDPRAGAMLAFAALAGTADGWLGDDHALLGDRWLSAAEAGTAQDPIAHAFARMAAAARARL